MTEKNGSRSGDGGDKGAAFVAQAKPMPHPTSALLVRERTVHWSVQRVSGGMQRTIFCGSCQV